MPVRQGGRHGWPMPVERCRCSACWPIPPIVQRTDHVDALGLGLGVTSLDPEGKAAGEMAALWQWINRRNAHGEAARVA